MDLYFEEDREFEEHKKRHAERMARMRAEKELYQKRAYMVKRFAPLVAGTVGVVLLVALIAGASNKAGQEIADIHQMAGAESLIDGQNAVKVVSAPETLMGKQYEKLPLAIKLVTKMEALEGVEFAESIETAKEKDFVEVIRTPKFTVMQQAPVEKSIIMVERPIVYEFARTEKTVGIYSEEVDSPYAILVDASMDTIVASKNATERISPASMTKVLTVLVAAEHVTKEQLDDTFTMTLEITDYAYVNDCSSVGFLDQENVTVRDLFYGTILPSGGDAAVGLATYVAGSHEAFVDMMNEKLEELGLSDTAHFTNCVGLYDKEHYCSVYDMAVIMKAAMENEMCREFLTTRTYTTVPTEQHPEGITVSNWFIRRIEDRDTGGAVIGAKTGYVVQSKSCAVSYGTFAEEKPYICVTAGAYSSWRCIDDHAEIYSKYTPTVEGVE